MNKKGSPPKDRVYGWGGDRFMYVVVILWGWGVHP